MPINSFLYPGAKVTPAYEVANSVRFNDGDSPRLVIANPTAGTRTKGTFSTWFKRCTLGTAQYLFSTWNNSASGYSSAMISFQTDDRLNVSNYVASGASGHSTLITERVFRDCSAWYHVCINWDTTDSETDRYKIFVNGTRETVFNGTPAYPTSSQDLFFNAGGTSNPQHIGFESVGSDQKYFDGYLAETVHIEGNDLDASSFGEFDEDSPTIWKPKDVSGLTFGDEGFYLDYEDSGDLGDDESGNGNDFAETNLAAADQATDTPTNNFATLNPLHLQDGVAYAEGNCKVTMSKLHNHRMGQGSTIAAASGKWYCEVKCKGGHDPDAPSVQLGVLDPEKFDHDDHLGNTGHGYQYAANGSKAHNGTVTTDHADTYDVDDIVSIAMDLDNHKLYYAKNGTWQDSGDPTSGSTGTGSFFDLATGVFYSFTLSAYDSGTDPFYEWNFGGCPAFSISSGNSDANGYGNFEYSVPSGYYALCTKNLGEFGG